MMTPYDWQEGIGHRAQYVESRLSTGVPVIAVSLDSGILAVTYRRQSRKVFEIYDRLMFAGLGQQSDVEAVRTSAIDYCHQEGFQRSEQDVTIQRVVSAISGPIKASFADFAQSPVVAKSLFMQIGETPEEDRYYEIDYDGDFCNDRGSWWLTGSELASDVIRNGMAELNLAGLSVEEAIQKLDAVIIKSLDPEETATPDEICDGLTLEAAIMDRTGESQRLFTLLHGDWD